MSYYALYELRLVGTVRKYVSAPTQEVGPGVSTTYVWCAYGVSGALCLSVLLVLLRVVAQSALYPLPVCSVLHATVR